MLSPEHVRARRRGDKLLLSPLSGSERAHAVQLAEELLTLTTQCVGLSREEVEEAWSALTPEPKALKIFEGLCKLVGDSCEFGAELASEPRELRRDVFLAASAARQALEPGASFDREAVLTEVAARHGVAPDVLERGLYADLRGAQRLERLLPVTAEELVVRYDQGQLQAVLLRAVRLTLLVSCARAEGYRRLFQKLKFRRLLHSIERLPDGRYRICVDGPFSLFESVTKYGLQLALLVPALLECDRVELEAELRWGVERRSVTLTHELVGGGEGHTAELREDVAELLSRLEKSGSKWRARPASDVLDLPGVGLCVPDLVFERAGRPPVYLEVLGFWSREAVWKRIELAQAGLGARVLFAVSSRLRVSEELLEESTSAALYVYKSTLSAKTVLDHVERLGAALS